MRNRSCGIILCALLVTGMLSGCRPSEPCRDPLGCLELDAGQSITIGAPVPLTGQNGTAGEAALSAVQAAADKKGNILGHAIRVQKADFDCTNDQAVTVAERLTGEATLVGAIAPACVLNATLDAEVFIRAGIAVLAQSDGSGSQPEATGIQALSRSDGSWTGEIDAVFAGQAAQLLFAAIENCASLRPDGVLVIPRQGLQKTILQDIQSGLPSGG
jgi:hypothetical protein